MQTYLVGGAIRDFLLNRPVVERDYLVVNSTIEEMLEKGFIQVGKDFPVFLHPVTKDEYALARVERKIGTGYYGFKCDSSKAVTLEEDLVRRDLTINAMCYDVSSALSSRSVERAFEKLSDFQGTSLEEGTFEETSEVPSEVSETFEKTERLNEDKIIDPFGGKSDIQNRILRHVSDAFAEDPVRVLRVARFMARYYSLGFRVAPETMELMKLIVSKGEIDNLVPERVWKELEKALSEKDPQLFFETLRECGALHVLLPNFYVDVHPIKWPSADYIDSNYSLGLDALKLTQNFSKEIRLAAFLHTMNYKEIEKLALRFRFPNSYKELAVLVARYSDLAIGLANVSEPEKATKKKMELANAFLNLFNSLNVIHQIERFEDFLNTVNAIFKIEDENREFPVQMFLEMASRYKEESSKLTQKLLSEGISGKKMATVLEQERLKFLVMIK